MIERQTLFPNTSQGFARAASDMPVLLNGMRVLFDEKVALYPVELEPESPSGNTRPTRENGSGRDDRRYQDS